jgi:Ca2+-binding RTX toxin-like protein
VAATDGLQRILHDTASGALRYDSDGNGTGAAVLFANLNPGAPLTAAAIALTGTTPAINGTINADNLLGTAGNNTINGLAGNDTIDGLAGNDTMNGGLGDDTFTVDSALDVVVEALNEGTDTVLSSVNHTLAANVENLTLTGTALNGTGNALANTLAGNASNNTLNGGAGADILNGGAGVDTLTGGLGADSFRFDAHGAANTDLITDFNIAEGDRIALSATVFTGIGAAGASLTAVQFRSGAGVITANARDQRILFNTTTGALFWDADGSRITFGPIQFATLNPVATLTNTQFTLV